VAHRRNPLPPRDTRSLAQQLHDSENARLRQARVSGTLKFSHKVDPIAAEIYKFPATFGLSGFPGYLFRISRDASYIPNRSKAEEVMLYTQVMCANGRWADFAKGSPAELRREIVAAPRDPKNRAG
jgi:hypothetical protein